MHDDEVRSFIPALRRYAWGLCRHSQDADDLVQDCLMRALGAWHLRRPDGNTRSWLFTILYNGFISGKRREVRRRLEETESVAAIESPQEQRLVLGDVGNALAALPDEQRAVLLLVAVEDFSYAEAAQTLGVPIGTVMSRLSRARERMRQVLDGDGGTELRLRRVK